MTDLLGRNPFPSHLGQQLTCAPLKSKLYSNVPMKSRDGLDKRNKTALQLDERLRPLHPESLSSPDFNVKRLLKISSSWKCWLVSFSPPSAPLV